MSDTQDGELLARQAAPTTAGCLLAGAVSAIVGKFLASMLPAH